MRCLRGAGLGTGGAWCSVKSQESPWGAAGHAAFVDLILGFCSDLWGLFRFAYVLSLRQEGCVLDARINVIAFLGGFSFSVQLLDLCCCLYWRGWCDPGTGGQIDFYTAS